MSGMLLALLVVVLLPGASAPQGQGAIEQELIALDKRFDEARRKGDTAAVADMLTEDFLRVTGAAVVQSKTDVLKAITSQPAPPPPPQDSIPPAYSVQLHGDTAVMVHSSRGNAVVPASAVMHVFVKQQGRWKMAAWGTVPGQPSAEQGINFAGYRLMDEGRLKEAIELFKQNVQLYPQSWNAYDSLGEAYMKVGDTALAIANYEKSVQLNPKNETGIAALAKLRAK